MPILWRYCLGQYLKVFSLSIATFVATLIVFRFKEIARFTALSGDILHTMLFVTYQIPLILPLALPISALIASLLLFQTLSKTSELTAFRSATISLKTILTPLLLTSALLSIFNFFFCAEISPYCRRESKELLYRKTSSNPLVLMQRQNLIQIKRTYLDMDVDEAKTAAKHFTLIAYNQSNQRLSLFSARKLSLVGSTFLGYDVSILSHLQGENPNLFDPLIIENQSFMSTGAPILSGALKKNHPHIEVSAMSLRMLLIRSHSHAKLAKGAIVEILRRISLSLSVFTLTLLGCCFGIETGRVASKKGLLMAISLTLFIFISYFLGKGLKTHPLFATLAFLIPHPAAWFFCIKRVQRIERGYLNL